MLSSLPLPPWDSSSILTSISCSSHQHISPSSRTQVYRPQIGITFSRKPGAASPLTVTLIAMCKQHLPGRNSVYSYIFGSSTPVILARHPKVLNAQQSTKIFSNELRIEQILFWGQLLQEDQFQQHILNTAL